MVARNKEYPQADMVIFFSKMFGPRIELCKESKGSMCMRPMIFTEGIMYNEAPWFLVAFPVANMSYRTECHFWSDYPLVGNIEMTRRVLIVKSDDGLGNVSSTVTRHFNEHFFLVLCFHRFLRR